MLSFAHPLYLWLLPTLAGPIILHLLNRQRLRSLVFPSIRFLRQAQIPQDGRRRLRDIPRLLLRLAFLTAVIVFMAGPKWTPPPAERSESNMKTAVFLLDASASMGSTGRVENGRRLVNEALKELNGWYTGAIVYASQILSEATPAASSEQTMQLVDDWKTTYACGLPEEALRKAVSMLGTSGHRRLFIASDFQLGDWNQKLSIVPQNVEISFLDASNKQSIDNVAIVDTICRPLSQNRLQIIVSVRNFSLAPQKRTVSLTTPGNETLTQDVEIRPKSVARCPFVIDHWDASGQGRAFLSQDDYPLDDSRLFWTAGRPPISILLIPSDSDDSVEELFFTQKAFAAGEDDGLSEYKLAQATIDSLDFDHLADFQAIFLLSSAETMDDATMEKLCGYVKNGGILFVTGGGSASIALRNLQKAAIPLAQSSGIAGAASRNAALGVGSVAANSPLDDLFGDRSDHDLYLFPIRKHHRLAPLHGTSVLMQSLEQQPLLISQNIGKGNVFFFAFGFSREWSDFPLTNSFLPLLRELTLASVPHGFGEIHIFCGDRHILSDGKEADTSHPALFMDGSIRGDINVPLRESMIESINLDDLRMMLKSNQLSPSTEAAPQTNASRDFTRWFGWLAVLLFLLEILL